MKISFLTFIFLTSASFILAQTNSLLLGSDEIAERVKQIVPDTVGDNIFVLSTVRSLSTNSKLSLAKYDTNYQEVWRTAFGGETFGETPVKLLLNQEGTPIVVSRIAEFDTLGTFLTVITRFTADGQILSTTCPITESTGFYPYDAEIDRQDRVLLAGRLMRESSILPYAAVIDETNNVVDTYAPEQSGSYFLKCLVTRDGNYAFLYSINMFNNFFSNIGISKLTPNFTEIWQRHLNDFSLQTRISYVYNLAEDSNGTIYYPLEKLDLNDDSEEDLLLLLFNEEEATNVSITVAEADVSGIVVTGGQLFIENDSLFINNNNSSALTIIDLVNFNGRQLVIDDTISNPNNTFALELEFRGIEDFFIKDSVLTFLTTGGITRGKQNIIGELSLNTATPQLIPINDRHFVNIETGFDVITTRDGNLLVLADATYVQGDRDILLLKVTPTGEVLWSHTYDYGVEPHGNGLLELPNGEIIVTISAFDENDRELKAFTMKTSSSGEMLWSVPSEKRALYDLHSIFPFIDGNNPEQIAIIYNGRESSEDFLVLSYLDFSGNILSTHIIPTATNDFLSYRAKQLNNGDFLVSGVTFAQNLPALTVKFTSTGELLWEKYHVGEESFANFSTGINVNSTETTAYEFGIAFSTVNENRLYVIQRDLENGLPLDTTILLSGDNVIGYDFALLADDNYLIGGQNNKIAELEDVNYKIDNRQILLDNFTANGELQKSYAEEVDFNFSNGNFQTCKRIDQGYIGVGEVSKNGTRQILLAFNNITTNTNTPIILDTQINVFPNPATENITYTITNPILGELYSEILDNQGRVLYCNEADKTTETFMQELSVNHLPTGIYYIKIQLLDRIFTRKVIIK